MPQRKTTEKFIQEARDIHGDKYSYTKVVYKSTVQKVTITCPLHGDFLQMPHSHINGSGCSSCTKNKKITTTEFIERAVAVHGDFYDYSEVDYQGQNKKVKINCPNHKSFLQRPSSHLRGYGCYMCSYEQLDKKRLYTEEQFTDVEWRDIAGYASNYSVSNTGLVRSNARVVNDRGNLYNIPERMLGRFPQKHGHLTVNLSLNGIKKGNLVHRLVALAFIPNPENKPHINHIDGDPTNNCTTNLEWCTQKENSLHASKLGRMGSMTQDRLDKVQVLLDAGLTRNEVIRQLNISQSCIYKYFPVDKSVLQNKLEQAKEMLEANIPKSKVAKNLNVSYDTLKKYLPSYFQSS